MGKDQGAQGSFNQFPQGTHNVPGGPQKDYRSSESALGKVAEGTKIVLVHTPTFHVEATSHYGLSPPDDTLYTVKQRKPVPHEFVLDAIAPLSPWTRSMFGCLAIYVEDKIVLILRDKRDHTADNGVWLAN